MPFLQAAFLAQENDKRFRKVGSSGWMMFVHNRLYWCDEYENHANLFYRFGDGPEQLGYLNYKDLNAEWEVEL